MRSPLQALAWLLIIAGLAALYVPTAADLLRGIWSSDEQKHGPIVLAAACWLLYRKWPEMLKAGEGGTSPAAGWPILLFGLVCYVLGRSQAIQQLEVGSLPLALIGLILITLGPGALRKAWFPLFFMLFMIPLPGVFVQTLTIPMKTAVSVVAAKLLYAFDYPVARSGVILSVGQYQLLVADACAGLHSLFSLESLGLLYMNLMGHASVARNITLALLIVPIAFCANVVRVILLVLITYHLGDAAGQGYVHGFAGMTVFLVALVLILAVDGLLSRLFRPKVPHGA